MSATKSKPTNHGFSSDLVVLGSKILSKYSLKKDGKAAMSTLLEFKKLVLEPNNLCYEHDTPQDVDLFMVHDENRFRLGLNENWSHDLADKTIAGGCNRKAIVNAWCVELPPAHLGEKRQK
jgi:hypothetical protein